MANYNFVYMGDTWIAKENTSSIINYTGEFIFNKVLLKAKKNNPRFVLHGGDAVFSGTRDSLIYFKQKKVKKAFPSTNFYVTPGNHDAIRETVNGRTVNSFANFRQIIGPLNFTITAPDLKVVAVNTVQPSGIYGLTKRQLNYLQRELANSNARFKIVSTHVPPFEWDKSMNANKERFLKLLTKYHVSMVLLSHVHGFRSYKVNNIPYIISGGAGAALDKGQVFHLILLTVCGNRLTAKRMKVGWIDNRGFDVATSPSRARLSRTAGAPRVRVRNVRREARA